MAHTYVRFKQGFFWNIGGVYGSAGNRYLSTSKTMQIFAALNVLDSLFVWFLKFEGL